jgi:hypothetical protein
MAYQGKILRLHQNCIFVQLDGESGGGSGQSEFKSVVFRHKPQPGQVCHYTPQNESARIVLDFLTRNTDKEKGEKGTTFEDIRDQLVFTFQVTIKQAEADLTAFLDELAGYDLLEAKHSSDHIPTDNRYSTPHGTARGQIEPGHSVVTVGYQVSWYWG